MTREMSSAVIALGVPNNKEDAALASKLFPKFNLTAYGAMVLVKKPRLPAPRSDSELHNLGSVLPNKVEFGVGSLSCEPFTPKTYLRSTTRKTFEEGNNTPRNWELTPSWMI